MVAEVAVVVLEDAVVVLEKGTTVGAMREKKSYVKEINHST